MFVYTIDDIIGAVLLACVIVYIITVCSYIGIKVLKTKYKNKKK